MTILIRKSELNDAEAISRLVKQWGYESTLREVVLSLKKIEARGSAAVFVAETGPVVIGWIYVAEHIRLGSESVAEIFGLVVDEEFRQQGIGKKLLTTAKDWSVQNGFSKLVLRTNTKREEANLFYPKAGFELIKTQNIYQMIL